MSEKLIKACIDRIILPPDLQLLAAKHAIDENSENTPMLVRQLGILPTPARMAYFTGKKWRNGRTLQVRFLDGESSVQTKVERYAHQWSQFANITFEFGSAPGAEIRISFQPTGSWSHIGTDCLLVENNQPTMNFGWLAPATPDEEYSRVVLHEFGHALGCIHEHQSPAAGIHWDKEAVYRLYMGPPNNWTREEVDENIFSHYSQSQTQFTNFDPTSIMEYPIPNELTTDDFEVGWNTVLSETDKTFIAEAYPLSSFRAMAVFMDTKPLNSRQLTPAAHRSAAQRLLGQIPERSVV